MRTPPGPRAGANAGNRAPSSQSGERHGNAQLTDKHVAQIRRAAASGKFSVQRIADYYGISRQHCTRIIKGEARVTPQTIAERAAASEVPDPLTMFWALDVIDGKPWQPPGLYATAAEHAELARLLRPADGSSFATGEALTRLRELVAVLRARRTAGAEPMSDGEMFGEGGVWQRWYAPPAPPRPAR